MVDDNRVILKRCTDYRSSARGTSESVSRFIATQGPLSHTSEDLWEMIIQYHCPVIVMLTRVVDNTVVILKRCTDYISSARGYINASFVTSEEPPLSVLHVQYPEWPDHGVPKDTLAVREIFKRIAGLPPRLGPIVVHCRSQRIGMVQTLEQYLFCYDAIIDELENLISDCNSWFIMIYSLFFRRHRHHAS
ncbi:Protein-tyrosine-phosphatase PTP1 [Sesamum angolense]|uniref:Protein-tyrosine-phosphatase PTP1 n=1 Tax=Sesamum angolense TaxID=2727404 RepID=A0AAE1W5Q7_9LAMI|nr:Protein-tyrosine-phosphatase PTP1 [Sesamum angolense]